MSADALADLALEPGTRIGPYRIESFLARGGMGVVVRAVDENLGRAVAIKIIDPRLGRDDEFRERFSRECRVLAAIRHPNIVTIYFQDEFEGAPFFAMELVGGFSLDRILEDMRGLDWRTSVGWMIQCCSALEAAREKDIIHRDLKPGNILIDENNQVRIVDFGLAKQAQVSKDLTAASVFLGTPHYVSPEQASGQPLDWRTDLYSLGATFYRVFAGQPVFDAPSVPEIVAAHIREPHRPLAEVAPSLPAALCRCVDTMLAKEPARRGSDGYRETIAALEEVLRSGADAAQGLAAQATLVGTLEGPAAGTGAAPASTGKVPLSGQDTLATDRVAVAGRGPGAELYAWLVPEGGEEGPDIALLRGESLGFGSRTANPLYLPEDPRNRRISRAHGAFAWSEEGYRLRVLEGRGGKPPPACVLDGEGPLEPGDHPLPPGARIELRGGVTLRVDGEPEEGLRVRFEAEEGTKAARFAGKWSWVLMRDAALAGAGERCGIRVPGEGAPEEAFRLRVGGGEVRIEPLCEGLRVDGAPLEGPRALAGGELLEGPGFSWRFEPVARARDLWEA